jgi:hypothetical protein
VDKMGNVRQRLKGNLRAIKGAAACGAAGLKLLRATLFSLGRGFVRVLAAARLVENALDCCR